VFLWIGTILPVQKWAVNQTILDSLVGLITIARTEKTVNF